MSKKVYVSHMPKKDYLYHKKFECANYQRGEVGYKADARYAEAIYGCLNRTTKKGCDDCDNFEETDDFIEAKNN